MADLALRSAASPACSCCWSRLPAVLTRSRCAARILRSSFASRAFHPLIMRSATHRVVPDVRACQAFPFARAARNGRSRRPQDVRRGPFATRSAREEREKSVSPVRRCFRGGMGSRLARTGLQGDLRRDDESARVVASTVAIVQDLPCPPALNLLKLGTPGNRGRSSNLILQLPIIAR